MIDLMVKKKKKMIFYLTDTRFLLALRAKRIGFLDFNFGLSVVRLRPFFCAFLLEVFRIFSALWSFFNFSDVNFLEVFVLDFFLSAFKRLVTHPFLEALLLFCDSVDLVLFFFVVTTLIIFLTLILPKITCFQNHSWDIFYQ